MKVDAYIEVEAGTDISHDLLPVDAKVEIQVGSAFACDAGALRLSFSDLETLARLAKVVIDARDALMLEQRRS